MPPYEKTFEVRWADLDPNRHLRHTAFSDYATHVRFSYLAENGFGAEVFEAQQFGPVIFRETAEYRAEVVMGDRIHVDFTVGEISRSGRRWTVHHTVRKDDGTVAAFLTLEGGWLDLERRRLRTPPDELFVLLERLPRRD